MDDMETRLIRLGDGWRTSAVRLQESVSRPAPEPLRRSAAGNPRMDPAFAEWSMFWPRGWVTDPAIGLSRKDQLRIIGNGVVPPQAVAAFRQLLSAATVGGASMTDLIVNPSHAHGFDRFERIDEGWRGWCMCGACWQAPTKAWASRLLHKHLAAEAREFRKVRNALRKQTIGGAS